MTRLEEYIDNEIADASFGESIEILRKEHLMSTVLFLLFVHGSIAGLCFWIVTRPLRALLWAEFVSTLFSIGLIWLFVAAGHGLSGSQTLAIASFGVVVPMIAYGILRLLLRFS